MHVLGGSLGLRLIIWYWFVSFFLLCFFLHDLGGHTHTGRDVKSGRSAQILARAGHGPARPARDLP